VARVRGRGGRTQRKIWGCPELGRETDRKRRREKEGERESGKVEAGIESISV
jgi:hypothetical protein